MRREYRVLTPEYVEFSFELAGLGSRLVAALIDFSVVVELAALGCAGSALVGLLAPGLATALMIVAVFLAFQGYPILLETLWNGQTVGKRLLNLRVIQDTGLSLGFYQAVIRNLFRMIDTLPMLYLVGAGVAFSNRHWRRLGDYAAGTIVVKVSQPVMPSQIMAPEDQYNTLQEDAMLRQQIRRRLTLEEKELLLEVCLRREQLQLSSRVALFGRFAAYFARRLDRPRDEFMSEEKFVQNIAAIALAESHRQAAQPHA
jgi:uncharacterized RDD family membrane protein YckC